MRNIKLTIEYDGSNYHGWQRQMNANSVQDVLEKTVRNLTCEDTELIGASRTDAGVHAFGQTANFLTSSSIPSQRFTFALNRILPRDIVVKSSEEVRADFHSRYDSKGKEYQYKIYNSCFRSAILNKRAYHVSRRLDISEMKKAAESFLGKHDFKAFMATGSTVNSTTRTITDINVKSEDDIITFVVKGDGFLYNMVRILVGTLIEVGIGKKSSSEVVSIIESKDRENAGKTLPAYGLYLMKVFY